MRKPLAPTREGENPFTRLEAESSWITQVKLLAFRLRSPNECTTINIHFLHIHSTP
jgi:hypothetical protein